MPAWGARGPLLPDLGPAAAGFEPFGGYRLKDGASLRMLASRPGPGAWPERGGDDLALLCGSARPLRRALPWQQLLQQRGR